MPNVAQSRGLNKRRQRRVVPFRISSNHTVLSRLRAASQAARSLHRRDLELWGLSGLPENLSVRQYGPSTRTEIESILVPVAGGPNSQAAVRVAVEMASGWNATLRLLTIVDSGSDAEHVERAETRLQGYATEISGLETRIDVAESDDVVSTIAERSHNHGLIVIGDSERTLFKRLFTGPVPQRLSKRADAPIIVVERTG